MIAFLFWNLRKKPLERIVANLALRHNVDVLILTECIIPPEIILKALNPDVGGCYQYAPSIGSKKVEIYCRFLPTFIAPKLVAKRFTVRHLNLPGAIDILLVCVHSPDKDHWSDESQACEGQALSDDIKKQEKEIGHSRTVLVGDLNMNPFESGVVNAGGLHGVMTRRIAEKKTRIVQGRKYPFFYNPMWAFFGDRPCSPPGTYYFRGSEHKVFFWNIFDQVLIRPDLLPRFNNKDIEILQTDGSTSLLSLDGLPDTKIASDHLPVLFRLGL